MPGFWPCGGYIIVLPLTRYRTGINTSPTNATRSGDNHTLAVTRIVSNSAEAGNQRADRTVEGNGRRAAERIRADDQFRNDRMAIGAMLRLRSHRATNA